MLDLLSRLPARLLFLKALSKKEIFVPAYTRADGTYVPAHHKTVNYNPDHHAVVSGKSSHSHKEALKQLGSDPEFKKLPVDHQSHALQSLGQDIQTAASKGAQVSTFKKQLLAGKKPKPAEVAAFKELQEKDPQKGADILSAIVDAIGLDKYLELCGVQAPPPPKAEPAGPSAEELATASEKLQAIAAGSPGMKVGQQAYKLLEKDPAWVKMNAVDRLQAVVDKWKELQAAATHGAKISTLTGKLAAGKVPSPSELKAYDSIDDNAKFKVAQNAIKKSGGKQTFGTLAELMKQAEAKAGITVDKPEVVPLKPPPHFGEKHEGQALGVKEGKALFKYEGVSWSMWNGDSWAKVGNFSWIAQLEQGKHPLLGTPLEVTTDPQVGFGPANAGKVFDAAGPYLVKWLDGQWWFKMKDSGDGAVWSDIKNPDMVKQLDAGKQVDVGGKPLVEVADESPQPDSANWVFTANDPGFGDAHSLTFDDQKGNLHYIAYEPIDGTYQVGSLQDGEPSDDHKDYAAPERVVAYLQAKGIHPPDLEAIQKLEDLPIGSPEEGDTKQGVGGVLTLKDGHWTLNNSAVISFFTAHGIAPGGAVANAVVKAFQSAAAKDPWGVTMDALKDVKAKALAQGWPIETTNELISAINGETAKMLVAEGTDEKPASAGQSFLYDHLLHHTEDGHNKFWQVTVDPEKGTATTHWGKIGTKGQSKTYQHGSAKKAYDAAVEAAAAKQKKGYVSQSKVDAPANQAMAQASAPSFGTLNANKVFSSVTSTGATAFYKFSGGGWWFSFDPNEPGSWDEVSSLSKLHDQLEKGKAANGNTLLDLGPVDSFGQPFQPKDGWVYESTISTGKIIQFVHKNGVWHNVKMQDGQPVLVANVATHWLESLKEGKGVDGQPLVEAYSFDLMDDKVGFGAQNPDKVFVSPKTDDPNPWLYRWGALEKQWKVSKNGGAWWSNLDPQGTLATALDSGVLGGVPLVLHAEDVYGNPQAGAGTTPGADTGPHEGDLKPGANGWLVLKNGHWVKASIEDALNHLCPIPDSIQSTFFKQALGGATVGTSKWKKTATTKMGMPNVNLTIEGFGKFIGRAKKGDDGVWKAASAALSAKNMADALNFLEHADKVKKAFAKKAKTLPAMLPGAKPPTAAPVAPAGATVAPTVPGVPAIDGWAKIGGQGGFNPGGTYRDPDGDEWYCKFPAGGAKVARNELLANKLYEAAGVPVPEVKLVTQAGKIGIASRIVKGAVQDVAALKAAKGAGLLEGFVADAWLANWDVVGNNPAAGKGWDNILFLNGKAVRIDPGGSMLFSGAGNKKADFGDTVLELDTMRDAKINPNTAAVFGKISQADLQASASKVLALSDADVEKLVKEHGPGDELEKAALAKTLVARKADIAAKFPKVAAKLAGGDSGEPEKKSKKKKLDPTKLPVKASDLPPIHDFMNWQGQGKAISDKPYVQQNIADEQAILDFALKGNLVALKEYKFQPVEKETGKPVGTPQPMAAHPSAHVKSYYDSVVTFLDVIANPPEPLKAFKGASADTIGQLAKAFKPFNYGHSVASVPPNQRLGFWIALGTVANPAHFQPVATFKKITAAAKAAAYSKWNLLPTNVRKFLKAVQGSGSANQPYRDGKLTDSQGQNCRSVLQGCYANASEHEEGFTIYKWINMPDAMVQQIMTQPEGLVFQNPGSMCCSRSEEGTQGFGNHRIIIHYAKGAKAMDTFGSGSFKNEQEVTTLPGARFMVLSRKKMPGKGYGGAKERLELEVLMLPPDETYVANLKEAVV